LKENQIEEYYKVDIDYQMKREKVWGNLLSQAVEYKASHELIDLLVSLNSSIFSTIFSVTKEQSW